VVGDVEQAQRRVRDLHLLLDQLFQVLQEPRVDIRQLVDMLDERPEVGLVGVRQVTPDGELYPTIRRFPNAYRALVRALLPERVSLRLSLGERELDLGRYADELPCDWTSGSFMLARREALESAGYLDERFFIYSEEPDVCLRMNKAGWEVRHLPCMTIVHHAGKAGVRPKMLAQDAFEALLLSEQVAERAAAVRADVREQVESRRLVDTVVDRFGGLDMLVNGATGPLQPRPVAELDWSAFEEHLVYQVKAVMELSSFEQFSPIHQAARRIGVGNRVIRIQRWKSFNWSTGARLACSRRSVMWRSDSCAGFLTDTGSTPGSPL
jgi:hypothetical protein